MDSTGYELPAPQFCLDHGLGIEGAFVNMARNEHIFKLGWHQELTDEKYAISPVGNEKRKVTPSSLTGNSYYGFFQHDQYSSILGSGKVLGRSR
jgi:hypothetical protein